jgi:PKD repeat protein
MDTVTGCDTIICDSSSVPCNLSLTVYHDTVTNILTPIATGGTPPYSYTINTGNWLPPFTYYPGWCITIIDANGCDTTICDTSNCQASFISTQVSASDSTFFTSLSSGTNASTSYFWDFGDGTTSTDENPVHLYATSGWYYVCLTIMDSTNNCYDTYCYNLNIVIASSGGCQAYFWSSLVWTPISLPNTYEFFDYSSGNSTNWLWDFGDGTTSTQQNPVHTYSATGSGFYLVCLTITEYDPITQALICTDTYCDSIYLSNQPSSCQADFYAQDLGNNEAIFTNTSYPQTGTTWFGFAEVDIDFGDGTNAFNIGGTINHTYANDGTYYVCVEVVESDSSGNILCTDTYCDSVTVTSGTIPCQAAFCAIRDSSFVLTQNPNGTTTTTISEAFYFCDLSTPVNNIQSWQWDMGDNGAGQYLQNTSSTSQMPVYEYDTNGVYYVCLIIVTTGGQCTSTTCDSVDFSMMQGQTAINEVNTFEALKLYPNPANDKLTVNLISNTNGNLSIRLVNMMGQTLSYENISIFNGAINHSLDVSKITNGVYSVEVVLNGEKQHKRVVISR